MTELEPATRASEAVHVASVRRYYEANTRRFVRFGQGKASIHRAVWGPGASTREQSMHWVDDLVVAELRRLPATPSVLDLGCGVGASLAYVAERTPARGVGITLSPLQCEYANELFAGSGVADRIRARVGDFHELDADLRDFDLCLALEAFVQSASAARFFASVAGALRVNGRLLVCDDFVEQRALAPSDRQHLAEFRTGWRLGALLRVDEVEALALRAGLVLVENSDLTPYLELGRPRDRAIGLALKVTKLLGLDGPYLSALRGGDALQRAIASGALSYRVLTFERRAGEGA